MKRESQFNILEKYFAPIETHQLCYSTLNLVNSFFKSIEWNIYPIGGTMLGAIRYGGLIPWDADVDLLCEPLSEEKENEFINFILSSDYNLEIKKKLWDGRRPGLQVRTKDKLRVVIDIFYGIIREGVMFSLGANLGNFPKEGRQGIDKLQINGNKTWQKFGISEVYLPPEEACYEYLLWKFGPNWNSEYSIYTTDHTYTSNFQLNSDKMTDSCLKSWIEKLNQGDNK